MAHRPLDTSRDANPTRIITEEVGDRTNSEAEYLALLKLLKLIATHDEKGAGAGIGKAILIYSDSEVMVNQLNGVYKVNEERLRKLWEEAKSLMHNISTLRIQHVPRDENLAGLWLEGKIAGRAVSPNEFLSDL